LWLSYHKVFFVIRVNNQFLKAILLKNRTGGVVSSDLGANTPSQILASLAAKIISYLH
jgi:hypothetical protein